MKKVGRNGAILLLACLALTGLWEALAHRSRYPFRPFEITASDFASFAPRLKGWEVGPVCGIEEDLEPGMHLFSLRLRGARAAHAAGAPEFVVRLTYGFNVPMCMKYKGYAVQEMANNLETERTQVWRFASPDGFRSIWVTSLLRAGDLARTDTDVRAMAFPRVNVCEDPSWVPRGLTADVFRRPVYEIRNFLRMRWNESRCDLLAFLKLRRPAGASDELLGFIACSTGRSVGPGEEEQVRRELEVVMQNVHRQLAAWRAGRE
ncbi:MAG: hypothetical protein JXR37_12620 [Kiritimatiellae bacterium]|nr:hypothetical protein [Kiritimatiellia bacterium]